MSAAIHPGLIKGASYVPEKQMLSAETLADYVSYQDTLGLAQSGGVLYARKHQQGWEAKYAARGRVLESLSLEHWPGPLRMITMPGHAWTFERSLIRNRTRSRKKGQERRTTFYSVERDQAIYVASLRKMPGIISNGITFLSPNSVCTHAVACYYYTTIEQFITDPNCPEVDAAWLDFTGYITQDRLEAIKKFWQSKCTWQLTITALNARYKARQMSAIEKHGGIYEWLINSLGGFIADRYSYQHEHAAMIQLTLQKDLRIPAEEWMNG